MAEVRRLEDWLTFPEAAARVCMTKQGLHRLVFKSATQPVDVDRDVRALGDNRLLLIRTDAVEALAIARGVNLMSE